MTSPYSAAIDAAANPVKISLASSSSVSDQVLSDCQSQEMAIPLDDDSFRGYHQLQMYDGMNFVANPPLLSEPAATTGDSASYQISKIPATVQPRELLKIEHYRLSSGTLPTNPAVLQNAFFGSASSDCLVPRSCANALTPGYSNGWQEESYHPSVYELSSQHQPLLSSDGAFQNYMESAFEPESEHFGLTGNDHGSFSQHHQEVMNSVESCLTPQTSPMQSLLPRDLSNSGIIRSGAASPTQEAARDKDLPYAKLIYQCLRDAPDHTMVLKEIYDWFKANTDKAQDPGEKGWQNSIRHNLSMNKAFQKIDQTPGDEPRRGYVWRLSDDALKEGCVQSTTRYRNKQPNKRGSKSRHPAPHRQASGSRGGAMSRKTSQLRRSERLKDATATLQESGHELRRIGVIRGHIQNQSRLGYFGSPPRSSFQEPVSSTRLSTPLSGCDMDQDIGGVKRHPGYAMLYPLQPDHSRSVPHPLLQLGSSSAPGLSDSYPNSPDLMASDQYSDNKYVLVPDQLFYDSPDSGSEPQTPGAFSDIMHIDPSPPTFYNGQTDGMDSLYGFPQGP